MAVSQTGQSGLQMSDLYEDNKSLRLFRKHNGFSPDQILKAIRTGHEIREKDLDDKVTAINKEQEALIESNKYISQLMTAAKALGNPSLGERDIFGSRSVNLNSSNPGLDPGNVIMAVPSNGAEEGSFSIQVDRIATKDRITATVAATSKSSPITSNQTQITIKGQDVSIPANSSLQDIASAINSVKTQTNVYAFVRKFSDTDYRLFLSNAVEGEKITLESIVHKLSGTFDTNAPPLSLAGTLVIGGEEKTISPSMSLNDIAALISTVPNYAASVTGIGPFSLEITHNAAPVSLNSVASEKLLTQIGIAESSSSADDLKAQFRIDGSTPILSAKNQIDGLYHKTTIHLLGPSNGATITADIQRNPSEALVGINDFIDAYNSLMKFAAEKTAKDPNNGYKPKEGAVLSGNHDFLLLIDNIKRSFSAKVQTGGSFSHLSQIGIQHDDDGQLIKNESKLATVLDSKLTDVESLFSFVSTKTSGGHVSVVSHPKLLHGSIPGKDINIEFTRDSSGAYAAKINLESEGTESSIIEIASGSPNISVAENGKITLKGPANTIYEGFRFFYEGPELEIPSGPQVTKHTQTLKVSQGLGDSISEKLNRIVISSLNSDSESADTNELNKLVFRNKKEKKLQERLLSELREKHSRIIKQEERKAERFQVIMEKVQEASSALNNIMASMFGG